MTEDLEPDELLVLNRYRKTKRDRHAKGEWAIKDGCLVKLDATEHTDIRGELDRIRRLREVGGGPAVP